MLLNVSLEIWAQPLGQPRLENKFEDQNSDACHQRRDPPTCGRTALKAELAGGEQTYEHREHIHRTDPSTAERLVVAKHLEATAPNGSTPRTRETPHLWNL
jgi:hypothetical protein